ncbi:MAG: bifunctional demethylmenaquinone methyltransferase/2-methoxy-6-polyprenyl-1,4-benzoquinol methylase [Gammaproteobacteria bacterium TMED78]|nr:MAG: bifunctional demethylmenaquinone methyltransferase/2-methoxy-6-polyprenyl-1,4-benzoquinol methylase [Gammaproteobacteria bacterium TMED78]
MGKKKNKINDFTDFGYQKVKWKEKKGRVYSVFDSVHQKYDLMNDLMSFGLHRVWKKVALRHTALRSGNIALDVAAGSCDLAISLSKQVGSKGKIFATDINANMLEIGRDKAIDSSAFKNISFVQADAENLPFSSFAFDCITIGFGLRNVTDKPLALSSMFNALKPGGRLLILEFSKANLGLLEKLYDFYSFNILPKIGEFVLSDKSSYEYLVESIRRHPNQDDLKKMMEQNGFENCKYYNLSSGIVSLHIGFRI